MRSRLWSLILRRLPHPFRGMGMELVKTIERIDRTAGQHLAGLKRSPAWYGVTMMGATALGLTLLLFFSFFADNDPTITELASKVRSKAVVTRDTMEASGDWATQDKWRIAHFFLEHRAPKKTFHHLDHDDLTEELMRGTAPKSNTTSQRTAFVAQRRSRLTTVAHVDLPEIDVQLNLARPKVAEDPKRFVFTKFARRRGFSGEAYPITRPTTRDSRLVVQAEWTYASDCMEMPPRLDPITRRFVPVPDPKWDIPPRWDERPVPPPSRRDVPFRPEVPDNLYPDIAYHVDLRREVPRITGDFPPLSRLDSVSARSQFPDFESVSRRSNSLISQPSLWARRGIVREHLPQDEVYINQGGLVTDANGFPIHEPQRDIDARAVPSVAEVALRLEFYSPKSVSAGRFSRSLLVIHNEGSQPIDAISVREHLNGLETVADAVPPAYVNPEGNLAIRKVHHLESGKNRRLALVWRPETEGDRVHRAVVMVEASVGSSTSVRVPEPVRQQPAAPAIPDPQLERLIPEPEQEQEPEPVQQPMPSIAPEPVSHREPAPEIPGLAFDVKNRPTAFVDDLVEIQILVRNTGDVALHHVKVRAELSQELKHRQGPEVECIIEELPVGGSESAILRAVADSSGKAVCRLSGSADERVFAKSDAVVLVEAQPVRSEPPRELTSQNSRPPLQNLPQPKEPAPARQTVSNGSCCCQSQPVPNYYAPWIGH